MELYKTWLVICQVRLLPKVQLKKIAAGRAESSNSCTTHNGWVSLWGADIPIKVKIHFWRLVRNGIAVGDELQRRKIKPGEVCIVCGQ
jgi:hypothetical protein